MASAPANLCHLQGQIEGRSALRHTPAGIPVIEFRIRHRSTAVENGTERKVECDLDAVAVGPLSRLLEAAPLDAHVRVVGFLAARSSRNRKPVLHVNTMEIL